MTLNNQNLAVMTAMFAIALAVAAVLFTSAPAKGEVDSLKCTTSSVALASVGNQVSSQILATSTNRAYARIQQRLDASGVATSTVNLVFKSDAAATVNTGLALNSTTSESVGHIDFGINTDFPYIGAVTGITSVGSTTLLVTECVY